MNYIKLYQSNKPIWGTHSIKAQVFELYFADIIDVDDHIYCVINKGVHGYRISYIDRNGGMRPNLYNDIYATKEDVVRVASEHLTKYCDCVILDESRYDKLSVIL